MAVADESPDSEWDAYSDFKLVSKWVTKSIRDAIEAFALLDQASQTNYKIKAAEEAQLRADILAAAMRLRVELESEQASGTEYAVEILDKWQGEDGFIKQFRAAGMRETDQLDWFEEFASDIRRAGWELGYLQAGRQEEEDHHGDAKDSEVYDVIEEMSR